MIKRNPRNLKINTLEISLKLDLTNPNSLKVYSTTTAQDGRRRQWKRYVSYVHWCWCYWRWRRRGESFKMFQVTVTHLWIVAKVLQLAGDWSQNFSYPFRHSGEAGWSVPPSLHHPPHHHHCRLLLWLRNVNLPDYFHPINRFNPWIKHDLIKIFSLWNTRSFQPENFATVTSEVKNQMFNLTQSDVTRWRRI